LERLGGDGRYRPDDCAANGVWGNPHPTAPETHQVPIITSVSDLPLHFIKKLIIDKLILLS
jgi:hypothetical protein